MMAFESVDSINNLSAIVPILVQIISLSSPCLILLFPFFFSSGPSIRVSQKRIKRPSQRRQKEDARLPGVLVHVRIAFLFFFFIDLSRRPINASAGRVDVTHKITVSTTGHSPWRVRALVESANFLLSKWCNRPGPWASCGIQTHRDVCYHYFSSDSLVVWSHHFSSPAGENQSQSLDPWHLAPGRWVAPHELLSPMGLQGFGVRSWSDSQPEQAEIKEIKRKHRAWTRLDDKDYDGRPKREEFITNYVVITP
jgi:hypothetical protein